MKKTDKIGGTSLQGIVQVDYDTLVKIFGEPHYDDGYKTDAEWRFDFGGITATIYNWKNGKNYRGTTGLETKDIRTWHVGGFNDTAIEVVQKALNKD